MSATENLEAAEGIIDPDTEDVMLTIAGDQEAFQRIFRRYSGLVIALAARFESDWQKREDILQTVFLHVFKHMGDLADPTTLKSWIGSIARNTCLSACRKARRDVQLFDDLVDTNGDFLDIEHHCAQADTTLPDLVRSEEARRVRMAVVGLTEPFKTLIDLHYFEDMAVSAISVRMHRPVGSVKSGLHRARTALCLVLSRDRTGVA